VGKSVPRGLWSRRQVLEAAAIAAVLAEVPALLKLRGWYDPAYALETNLTIDTFNGLVSLVLPGHDAYSIAQGESNAGPGGVDNGTTAVLIHAIDTFLPDPNAPGGTVTLSPAIANLLDAVAALVNPAAAGGGFISQFARLSFAEKGAVFARLEADTGLPNVLPAPFTNGTGNFLFVAGALTEFVAFLGMSEASVFDAATKTLRSRPLGWQISGYQPNGPVQGWDEFRGYYQGRKEVTE
jgi:hypothetical protein